MGVGGKEEVPISKFKQLIAEDERTFRAFAAINPYQKYFSTWDDKDFSLQNVLNALFFARDSKEHALLVKERVQLLAAKIDEVATKLSLSLMA